MAWLGYRLKGQTRAITQLGLSTCNRKKTAIFPRKHSSLEIGMFGCIDVNQPKERSPEVWHIPPETPCAHVQPILFLT